MSAVAANISGSAPLNSAPFPVRTDRNYSLPALQKEIRKYLKAEERTHDWAAGRLGVTRPYFSRALNDTTGEEVKHILLLERFVKDVMGYRLNWNLTFRPERIEGE